jgi:hypothetical protein
MKKTFIVLTILLTAATAANAQFFIEGELGMSYYENDGKEENITTINSSSLDFTVSPKVGYWLNERISVGVSASYIRSSSKTNADIPNQGITVSEYWSSSLGFSVFGRYQLYRKEKLSLLAECEAGHRTINSKNKTNEMNAKSTVKNIYVFPVILYDLTERISIKASCNFMRLGFSSSNTKQEINKQYASKSFGFHVGSETNSLPGIGVSFMYKF